MLGLFVLILVLGSEIGFLIYSLRTKTYQERTRRLLHVSQFVVIVLLMITGVIRFGFQWYYLLLVLLIRTLLAGLYFFVPKCRKEKIFRKKYVIMSMVRNTMLFIFAVFPSFLFPQFRPIAITGDLPIETVSYTLTDYSRKEAYSDKEESRKLTIQFWYPENADDTYPLLVFSHGAFGFRGSNLSTFENLASNGYVVCSIDHTYHAFFTKQTDGRLIIADMEFVNNSVAATNGDFDEETTYEISQEWLNLRKADVNFVLEDILVKAGDTNEDEVYRLIDKERIGVFGHSLGGATAAAIGRERKDIDVVIVVDGTMFGEESGFTNGQVTLNSSPYPVPLLNIYNEEHFNEAKEEAYPNRMAAKHAVDSREVMVKGSGHLNFTDLPMFSPFFAGMLGTGEVDSRYCIETTNQIILDYFDYYLKTSKELNLPLEY